MTLHRLIHKHPHAPLFALVSPVDNEVHSQVVANVHGKTPRAAIEAQVDLPRTVLHADNALSPVPIGRDAAGHESVNHMMSEYVRGDVTTSH
jgi:hypothetical protein